MRYVSGFFTFLVALLLLCSSVFASEFGMDDLPVDFSEEATESVSSYVSLDPNTISDLVDALNDAWDSRDALSDDATNPVIDISPDSVSALADAISNSLVDDDSSNTLENPDFLINGYYFTCDCAFQDDLTIYVPVEFAVDAFSLDSEGRLRNMTLNTFETRVRLGKYIYVITAPSMSPFTYHVETVPGHYDPMEVYDLAERVTDSNMSFLTNIPQAVPDSTYWIVLIVTCILGFLLIAFFKR